MYERIPGLKPWDVGMRILQHPAMQVTSALKRRFAGRTVISQSYSGQLEQTFKFPLHAEDRLAVLCERNRTATRDFLRVLGKCGQRTKFGPLWSDVSAASVVKFLGEFAVDAEISGLSPELISAASGWFRTSLRSGGGSGHQCHMGCCRRSSNSGYLASFGS
jgi:hypothetical protein